MEKMRSARAAAAYFREHDPGTGITEYAIRSLMDLGELPYIEIGCKRMTSIEAIERVIDKRLGGGVNE